MKTTTNRSFTPRSKQGQMRNTLPYACHVEGDNLELKDRDYLVLDSKPNTQGHTGQAYFYDDGCPPWEDALSARRCKAVLEAWNNGQDVWALALNTL